MTKEKQAFEVDMKKIREMAANKEISPAIAEFTEKAARLARQAWREMMAMDMKSLRRNLRIIEKSAERKPR